MRKNRAAGRFRISESDRPNWEISLFNRRLPLGIALITIDFGLKDDALQEVCLSGGDDRRRKRTVFRKMANVSDISIRISLLFWEQSNMKFKNRDMESGNQSRASAAGQ